MSRLAIIPARGGSKRIPHKNILPFLGRPMISYAIRAALDSGLFDEVMVSTDDEQIARIAVEYGASVPFMRSEQTSNDYATTADVLREVLGCYTARGEHFTQACCIYATSPLLRVERLAEAFERLEAEARDSVFAVVQYSYPPQRALVLRDGRVEMMHEEFAAARSQDLEPIYHDAGQFYAFDVERFMSTGRLWAENSAAIVLPEVEMQDIDTQADWQLAELKCKLLNG